MKALLTATTAGLTLLWGVASANAATVTLYDASQGTAPNNQGWIFLRQPIPGSATQSTTGGVHTLDTTAATTDIAAYGIQVNNPFTLNPTTGYTISFDVQVVSEFHDGSDRNSAVDDIDDRAGLSVLVVSSDLQGIEVAFWEDEIWVQEGGATEPPRFTHAEGVPYDTTAGIISYDLSVSGSSYALYAGGSSTPILTGSLRDYSAEGFPYNTANSLFLGDNTSSANAEINLTSVQASDAPITFGGPGPTPVPFEFSPTLGLLILGVGSAAYRFSQRRL